MKSINCMIDWLEFSIFGLQGDVIDATLGMLSLDTLSFEIKRSRFYKRSLVFDNMITISTEFCGKTNDDEIRNHVHVTLSGTGCRFLENLYNCKDLRDEINYRFIFNKLKISRMDIAVDYDTKFLLDIFEDSIRNKHFDGIKTWLCFGNYDNGITYYLGSTKSEKYIRIYEKDKQKHSDLYKDRVELVLKGQYATYEFFNDNDLFKIYSSYTKEIVWTNSTVQEVWENMMGENCPISPKIRHKKTGLKEKAENIMNTYGGTLKAYITEFGTKMINEKLDSAIMTQKDMRMLHNARVIRAMKYKKKVIKAADIAFDINNTQNQECEQIQLTV